MKIALTPSRLSPFTRPPRLTVVPTTAQVFGAILFLAQPASAADRRAEPSPAEERLFKEEAAACAASLKVAALGAKKAVGAEVRTLAEKIVADLTVANAELETLASHEGIRLTDDPISKYGDIYDQLVRTSGAEFDNAFLSVIVTGLGRSVKQLAEASLTTTKSALKEWAIKTLPLLQAHLTRATELNASDNANGNTR